MKYIKERDVISWLLFYGAVIVAFGLGIVIANLINLDIFKGIVYIIIGFIFWIISYLKERSMEK